MVNVINLFKIRTQVELAHFKPYSNIREITIMRSINSKEEDCIDDKQFYTYINSRNKEISIPINKIYLYGDIDLTNKDDIEYLYKYENYIHKDVLNNPSSEIPSNFNYDKGCAINKNISDNTFKPVNLINWIKYNHCLLGKPKKIIIFKITRDKL